MPGWAPALKFVILTGAALDFLHRVFAKATTPDRKSRVAEGRGLQFHLDARACRQGVLISSGARSLLSGSSKPLRLR
jgi:hypothetical protein